MTSTADEDGGSFAALVSAIRAELDALAASDADAIIAATETKVAAMAAVQADIAAGVPIRRDLLEEARDLNARAILESRARLIGIERELAVLSPLAGLATPPTPLVYGRDGRWA